LFERHAGGELAILVHIEFPERMAREDLGEIKELARASGVKTVDIITGVRNVPDAKYFVGSGKAEEIREAVLAQEAEVVIVNHALSPSQERNLERIFKCRVIDRSGLILDIFAQRARTFEGKLQVELAQLQHLSTRLIRGWTHLERQKGGIGLRGPGETQLETDRRLLRDRIKQIKKRLEKVRSQRDQGRRARSKADLPTVSLVGYTNAGKSSLFNALSGDSIFVADQLFATLDPTLRRIELPGAGGAILADTVGFIRHLPHDLVEAFRATLEETRDANLLLHVVDISQANWRDSVEAVETVLLEIDAAHIPVVYVYNKIDLIENQAPEIKRGDEHSRVWISAEKAWGLDLLLQVMAEKLYGDPVHRSLCLDPKQGKLRAELYRMDAVLSERVDEDGNWWLSLRLSQKDYLRLRDRLYPREQ